MLVKDLFPERALKYRNIYKRACMLFRRFESNKALGDMTLEEAIKVIDSRRLGFNGEEFRVFDEFIDILEMIKWG
jgi:hypothetical protein